MKDNNQKKEHVTNWLRGVDNVVVDPDGGECKCGKSCMSDSEYLYHRFESEGLIDKLKEKRSKRSSDK